MLLDVHTQRPYGPLGKGNPGRPSVTVSRDGALGTRYVISLMVSVDVKQYLKKT